jgi:hypothetical protein
MVGASTGEFVIVDGLRVLSTGDDAGANELTGDGAGIGATLTNPSPRNWTCSMSRFTVLSTPL